MKFSSRHTLRINPALVSILSVENNWYLSLIKFWFHFCFNQTVTRLQGTIVAVTWQGCDSDGPLDFGPSEAKEQNPKESSDLEYKTDSVSMNHATEFPRLLSSFHDRVHEKIDMWRIINKIPSKVKLRPAIERLPIIPNDSNPQNFPQFWTKAGFRFIAYQEILSIVSSVYNWN